MNKTGHPSGEKGNKMRVRNKGIKAWLVTWDYSGEHAKPKRRIATILNPHWSIEKVKQIIEILYVNMTFSLIEKIKYAKNKSFNPYPAIEYRGSALYPETGHSEKTML
jgi:hypothetical protein